MRPLPWSYGLYQIWPRDASVQTELLLLLFRLVPWKGRLCIPSFVSDSHTHSKGILSLWASCCHLLASHLLGKWSHTANLSSFTWSPVPLDSHCPDTPSLCSVVLNCKCPPIVSKGRVCICFSLLSTALACFSVAGINAMTKSDLGRKAWFHPKVTFHHKRRPRQEPKVGELEEETSENCCLLLALC